MTGVLIERAGFLASLRELLAEALDGSGRLVFLGGEAGVGKTTLATALADTALTDTALTDAAGPAVKRGSCDNVTTAEALGPLLDALPELAAAFDHDAWVTRFRLFQQVREVLSAAPMLLLLEDVHWADEATLDIVRFLGRRLAGTRLMILATFRSEELGGSAAVTSHAELAVAFVVGFFPLIGLQALQRVTSKALNLRRVGIRTATDLLKAFSTEQEQGPRAFALPPDTKLPLPVDQLRLLVKVLAEEPGLAPVWNWQRNGVREHRAAP